MILTLFQTSAAASFVLVAALWSALGWLHPLYTQDSQAHHEFTLSAHAMQPGGCIFFFFLIIIIIAATNKALEVAIGIRQC